jgi:hypothetical protein
MKTINLILLVIFSSFFSVSAEDNRTNGNSCFESDPVQELPWLKEMVERFIQNANCPVIEIHQCTYGNGKIGFLIGTCFGCSNVGKRVYSCDGTLLCLPGGIAGATCTEWNIDSESIRLI